MGIFTFCRHSARTANAKGNEVTDAFVRPGLEATVTPRNASRQ